MKLIDLLVKTAKREEMPKIIKSEGKRYMQSGVHYYSLDETKTDDEGNEYSPSLTESLNMFSYNNLNLDVEIIEEIESLRKQNYQKVPFVGVLTVKMILMKHLEIYLESYLNKKTK